MDTTIINFSNFELLFFGSIALFLFVMLLIIKRVFPFLVKSHTKKRIFKQYISIVEVGIWLLFILIAIQQLSDSNQLYAMGLFVLLMLSAFWVLWFTVKDFIAGALFKMNKDFEEKDIIQVDNFEGKIIELGNRIIKIESDSGEVIYIPYSKITRQTIVKVHPGEMVLSHVFTLRTLNKEKADLLMDKIRFEVLSLPWASIKRPPIVEIIHDDEDGYIFEVKLYSLEKKYFFKMEQEIRKKFEIG